MPTFDTAVLKALGLLASLAFLHRQRRHARRLAQLLEVRDQLVADTPTSHRTTNGSNGSRGIVICAGGAELLKCAWVNVSMLRSLGCTLPVEIWYRGREEMPEAAAASFARFGDVDCRDLEATDISRGLTGYGLKPLALIASSFREILMLDADNCVVRDPSPLFEAEVYRERGAVFWPDFWRFPSDHPLWRGIGRPDGAPAGVRWQQESGQVLIDRERCTAALRLCLEINRHPKETYRMFPGPFNHGDKDTFQVAWIMCDTPFHMVAALPGAVGTRERGGFLGNTLLQHGLDGEPSFLHRHLYKWKAEYLDQRRWTHVKRVRRGHEVGVQVRLRALHNFATDFAGPEASLELLDFADVVDPTLEDRCRDSVREVTAEPWHRSLVNGGCH